MTRRSSVHVMWGVPKTTGRPAALVTAYRPHPDMWDDEFKVRRVG